MARVAIFIDGGYIGALAMKEFKGVKLDFAKFSERITELVQASTKEAIDLLRTYYYNCLPHQGSPPTEDERQRYASARGFHEALTRLKRYEVREGRLAFRGINKAGDPIFQQKRTDLMLGLDFALLCGKHQIDHAVVIAGDSDFLPAFEAAKAEGVTVWLLHGPRNSTVDGKSTYGQDLWMAADERFELTAQFLDECRM